MVTFDRAEHYLVEELVIGEAVSTPGPRRIVAVERCNGSAISAGKISFTTERWRRENLQYAPRRQDSGRVVGVSWRRQLRCGNGIGFWNGVSNAFGDVFECRARAKVVHAPERDGRFPAGASLGAQKRGLDPSP